MSLSDQGSATGPRLSVVVAVEDGVDATLRALFGILEATRNLPHETIVVDDATTDETRVVLPQLEGLRVLRNDERAGPARSCNAGAALARAPWLLFVRSVPAVPPDRLAALLEADVRDPTIDAVVPGEDEPSRHGALLVRTDAFVTAKGFEETLDGAEAQRDLCGRLGGRVLRVPAAPELSSPVRSANAQARRSIREIRVAAGFDGRYELAVSVQDGERTYGASVRQPFAAPLGSMSVADPADGTLTTFTREELLAALSSGYDLANESRRYRPDTRPRVAFTVRASSVMGGGTIVLYRYVNWLHDMGVEVTIYSDDARPTWTTLNARFRQIEKANERYRAITEPVVVVYSVLELPALLACMETRGKKILHFCQGAEEFHWDLVHGASLTRPTPFFDLLNSIPVGRITVSPHLERYFADKYGQRSILVPNGVPTDLFTPPDRRERPRRFTVLTAGNPHHPLKNIAVVERALGIVARRQRSWPLHLVNVCGHVPLAPAAASSPFTSEYRSSQSAEAMRDAYRAADVFVNASSYEGFGLPTLEAMACGTPVVQADNHGLDDIVQDGRDCLMVAPGDAEALAAAIERLHQDPALRRTLATEGRKTALRHTLTRQREHVAAAFSEILGAPLERSPITAPAAEPRFSVMIPTYNQAHYVGPALDSLLAQTYVHWEAVVVNDGSTDGTAEVIERYARQDRRIRVFHQPNGGVAAALNRARAEASGDWVCWLSSDDLFLPHKLELHREAIASDPGIRFMHTDFEVLVEPSGRRVPSGRNGSTGIPSVEQQVLHFLGANYVNGISVAVHRGTFDAVGSFDPLYRWGQDYDMWLRTSARVRSRYLPRPTCVTRLHEAQGTALFSEAGIFDSARSALVFLDRNPLAALFPAVHLSEITPAWHAVTQALRVAFSDRSFIGRCGFGAALTDRVKEWLSQDAPEGVRFLIQRELPSQLRPELPPESAAALRGLIQVKAGAFRYTPRNAFELMEQQARRAERQEDAQEAAALRKYLKAIAAHEATLQRRSA